MTGRRIYVHAYSFRELCLSSTVARAQVLECLLGVSIKKMLFNRVVQDGEGVLYGTRELGDRLEARIGGLELPSATTVLGGIDFATRGGRGAPIEALLAEGEVIEATCFEHNYYTFATGAGAAAAMYADHEPIRQLRAKLKLSPCDPAISDLTLVSGRRLSWRADPGEDRRDGCEARGTANDLERAAGQAVARGRSAVSGMFSGLVELLGHDRDLARIEADVLDALPDVIDPVQKA